MNNRIKSTALLVNLGIYGAAFPLSAAETVSDSKTATADETMVVTAAEQNLQALAYQPSPQMKFVNVRLRATYLKLSVPCRALT